MFLGPQDTKHLFRYEYGDIELMLTVIKQAIDAILKGRHESAVRSGWFCSEIPCE